MGRAKQPPRDEYRAKDDYRACEKYRVQPHATRDRAQHRARHAKRDVETRRVSAHCDATALSRSAPHSLDAKRGKDKVQQARYRRACKTGHYRPFRALRVGGPPRPDARDQGRGELTSRHPSDHDGAEAQTVVNMQRRNRKRGPDHQKADQDGDHERRQRRNHGG